MPSRWQWTLNRWTAKEAQVCILELLLQLFLMCEERGEFRACVLRQVQWI